MPRKCGCGGIFKRVDIVFDSGLRDKSGQFIIWDMKLIRPGYASFKCNKCGNEAKQRLRKGK